MHKHAQRLDTHVEDRVVHVRVWWIMKTPKYPSMHHEVSESSVLKLDTVRKTY